MFSVCCAVADAILKDVFSMCDVIQHLLLSAGHGTYRLMITPPEPLSIIITPGHARRYVRIYTFLADLTRAVSALEKVDLREPKVGLGNRRALFYCCILMLRLMAGTRDHVVTELDAAWEVFKVFSMKIVMSLLLNRL
ncbi:unnamed protein product [Nippostrongylus brasiliensis]|uniref:Trafficking protein particle complex subunit n=1 Tax=Nippostrongylus brasiliensis TaxID=27835 RepID=A0A0N4Y748_NIPBR|nr:unnamed protein product [Nippostrongylus brasiliensis]